MIEIGQAVYFIESRGLDPVIKFGIVRDLWEDNGFYHYILKKRLVKRCVSERRESYLERKAKQKS